MLKIFITKKKKSSISVIWIRNIVKKLLIAEGIMDTEVSIVFADDPFIQALNKKYRDVDKPTDVLAFPFEESGYLGEVIISIDTAQQDAKVYGCSFEDELKLLLVHGLLHLMGHNHIEDVQTYMDKRQKELLDILENG